MIIKEVLFGIYALTVMVGIILFIAVLSSRFKYLKKWDILFIVVDFLFLLIPIINLIKIRKFYARFKELE